LVVVVMMEGYPTRFDEFGAGVCDRWPLLFFLFFIFFLLFLFIYSLSFSSLILKVCFPCVAIFVSYAWVSLNFASEQASKQRL